jgi:hypothetical protein
MQINRSCIESRWWHHISGSRILNRDWWSPMKLLPTICSTAIVIRTQYRRWSTFARLIDCCHVHIDDDRLHHCNSMIASKFFVNCTWFNQATDRWNYTHDLCVNTIYLHPMHAELIDALTMIVRVTVP